MLTFKAKTLAAKSKSHRRLNPHLNKTCRCAAGKNNYTLLWGTSLAWCCLFILYPSLLCALDSRSNMPPLGITTFIITTIKSVIYFCPWLVVSEWRRRGEHFQIKDPRTKLFDIMKMICPLPLSPNYSITKKIWYILWNVLESPLLWKHYPAFYQITVNHSF